MNNLSLDDFSSFFYELYGYEPYSWQSRLAKRAIEGDWPGAIDLPTGSGKTACIDIAVFSLACQATLPREDRTAPRRIVFCVNRRVIVDEAYQRSRKIAQAIYNAETNNGNDASILSAVAKNLRLLSGTEQSDIPPLDALELRGGVYRDNRWARSATQPTIICSTLDQIGSRLLFRGYGVTNYAAPIQAALLAYDSLILLDEAHISEPFRQTVTAVQRFLDPDKWAESEIDAKPLIFVPMTATPSAEMLKRGVIRLDKKDRENKRLDGRLSAKKVAKLSLVSNVVKEAVSEAENAIEEEQKAVGIIVNRVESAKAIYNALFNDEKLRSTHPDLSIELVIGSMRPVDRDSQQERLEQVVGPQRPGSTTQASLTVATQCLEVGADYDFDILISECASLDSLRQRFGRLNRAGRDIDAKAVVLAGKKGIKPDDKLDDAKPIDPIYGNSLSRTWNWLKKHCNEDDEIDFGIDAFAKLLTDQGVNGQPPKELLAPSASLNAPVLLPAYIDIWCQTSPRPIPEPEVSLFIHGIQDSVRYVQICWRSDLGEKENHWIDIVSLLPPTSAECMSAPISRVIRWLRQVDDNEPRSDVLGVATQSIQDDENAGKPELAHSFVVWRGVKKSKLINSVSGVRSIRPGDTVVFPSTASGWHELGHIPYVDQTEHDCIDVAESAWQTAKDRSVLRVHPNLREWFPAGDATDELFENASRHESRIAVQDWRDLFKRAADQCHSEDHQGIQDALTALSTRKHGLSVDHYPHDCGIVFKTRRKIGSNVWFLPPLDEGDDETSFTTRRNPVSLKDHTHHVSQLAKSACQLLLADDFHSDYELTAELHDLGKADERFQAMLRRVHRTDAWLLWENSDSCLAKSGGFPLSRRQSTLARIRAGLPQGFRHEILSAQLASVSERLPEDTLNRSLVLHLIVSHHGHARPLSPIVNDPEPPDVLIDGIKLTQESRCNKRLSSLDSGVAERFWNLTRCFGWWGLAYLESVFRLADCLASAMEDADAFDSADEKQLQGAVS